MAKKIQKTPTYVNAPGIVRVDFWSPDFDALVDNKGYDVVWERAIVCPCAKRQGAIQSNCKNCQGTGWVFINPKQIKAVTQSLNKDTKYKEWSQERLGTASFTVRSEYHLGFMDKITILNSMTIESENRLVYSLEGELLVNLIYPADRIVDIFKFSSTDQPLVLLGPEDYEIENQFVKFKGNSVVAGDSVTVSYEHKVQYHILDLNHDVRNTITLDSYSREQELKLPVSAVGRRVHNVIDALDYRGKNLFDNSYE